MRNIQKQTLSLSIFLLLALCTAAQRKKIPLHDSLDGKFDLSDYIIEMNGFIPVPYIITEKAVGGFGGVLAPVFLKQRPPYIDSIKGKVKVTPVSPDITGAAVGYTLNNTWFTAAFRQGTLIKSRIKYMVGGIYANVNMSYYRTLPQVGEKEFEFNIKVAGALLQATKRIGYSHWYVGAKYLFTSTNVEYKGDTIKPSFVTPKEYKSIISQLGAIVELDNRDNIFTPNKGIKLHVDGIMSDNIIGSDFDFWRMNYYTYMYKTFFEKLTTGLRIDGQQAFGSPPFYMLPYIDMRGVPVNRYQGKADILTELELRWDFLKRWSLMGFSGMGKAFDDWKDFGDAKLVVTYGSGFRYLMARKFGLRMGVDVAKGPETWTYYIVFGSNWLK